MTGTVPITIHLCGNVSEDWGNGEGPVGCGNTYTMSVCHTVFMFIEMVRNSTEVLSVCGVTDGEVK